MEAVNYNARWVKSECFSKGIPFPERYRSENYTGELLGAYVSACDFFEHVMLLDRASSGLPHFASVKSICKMPEGQDDFVMSFEECCMCRADQLIASGKIIEVYWSGGIDSTVALVSLIRAGIKRDQLRIFLTWNSLFEYPLFYHRFIKEKWEHQVSAMGDVKHNIRFDSNKIIVTGEHGDQIFGSHIIARYTMDALVQSYDKVVPASVADFLQPIISSAPCPIVTLYDWLWYCNFNLKWQNVKTRFILWAGGAFPYWELHLAHFFDTPEFQHWSMASREPKILSNRSTYKWAAKEFIYRFAGDEDYLYRKLKVNSLRNIKKPNKTTWCFILEDGSTVYPEMLENE
jgi:hypothetical protein